MILETKVIGRRTPLACHPIDLPDGQYTLQSLLTALVEHELAAYNERQDSVGVLRVLTEKELSEGAASGKIQTSPQARASTVSLQQAVSTALQGFEDGLYYVFCDDQQIEDLQAPLDLRPDSSLLLLRLVALAGG